jgi:hypothetical protein
VRRPLSEIGAYGTRDCFLVLAQDILQKAQPLAAFPEIRIGVLLKRGSLPVEYRFQVARLPAGRPHCIRWIHLLVPSEMAGSVMGYSTPE